MSVIIPHCQKCDLDRVFTKIAGLGNERTYGVEWACPKCDSHILDICPVGPLSPDEDTCLNCGRDYPGHQPFDVCPECGLTRLGVLDLHGLDPAPPDPMHMAEVYTDLGLLRRAMATLNLELVKNPTFEPAWRVKYAFLSGLGFSNAALAVIEAATEYVVNPDLLISYAHLLKQLGRGNDAQEIYREYLVSAPQGEYVALAKEALRQIGGARK